ncbi:hypothetical protein D3C73_1477880 [compost metagenome]
MLKGMSGGIQYMVLHIPDGIHRLLEEGPSRSEEFNVLTGLEMVALLYNGNS